MRIAISSTGQTLDSEVDPRFGRSAYFILVEPETMQAEAIENPNVESPTGAGIGAAQLVCDKGVGAVVTGRIGPKAHQVLSAAGVRMVTGASGTIRNAVEQFKAGKLSGEPRPEPGSEVRTGTGMGRGMGGGGGRGMGRGRRCQTGMGPGAGGGRALRDREAAPWPGAESKPDRDELTSLKQQAGALADELASIRRRIEQIENKQM